MTVQDLNRLDAAAASTELSRCCGCSRWVQAMVRARPFRDLASVYVAANAAWAGASEKDWLEAFSHHPRIGGKDALRAKFAATASWAQGEQASVAAADDAVLDALARGNADYEAKFGFIFIVCATGKSAREMLDLLRARLPNARDRELRLAADEQAKITRLRLEKLLAPEKPLT